MNKLINMCLKVIGEKHFALKFAASIVLKNVHFEMGNIGVSILFSKSLSYLRLHMLQKTIARMG